jgi:hypothetical protein
MNLKKSALDNSNSASPVGYIFVHDCIGFLLPHIGRMRQKTPDWVGNYEYDNGCLSGRA